MVKKNSTNCKNILDEGVYVCDLLGVPNNVSYLSKVPNEVIPLSRIGFVWNDQIKHLRIENFQPSEYYKDYLMTTSHSEKMQSLQSSQVDKLIAYYGGSGPSSIVEVGCGDGSFLSHARSKIPSVLGIEPSKRFYELAAANGHDVINGYLESSVALTARKFDSFVSRQVFEHLHDPVDVLSAIKNMLNAGAVGLIEVPNGVRAIREQRFYEFFPDHVNYYSVNSLVALATKVGFTVIGCYESFGGDYLELWVRNDLDFISQINHMRDSREILVASLIDLIRDLDSKNERIMVWGCGAKTLTMFSAGLSTVSEMLVGAIDSDPNKHDFFIPNTNLKIYSPNSAVDMMPDTIIILALSYREEISNTIKTLYRNCKKVMTVDDFGRVVSL